VSAPCRLARSRGQGQGPKGRGGPCFGACRQGGPGSDFGRLDPPASASPGDSELAPIPRQSWFLLSPPHGPPRLAAPGVAGARARGQSGVLRQGLWLQSRKIAFNRGADVAPHGGVAVEVEGRKKVWIDTNEIALDAVIIGVRAVFASVPGVGGASLAAAPLRKSASDATRSPSRPNRLFRNRNARFYGGQKCFAVGTPGLFSPNFASSSGQVLLWQEQSI